MSVGTPGEKKHVSHLQDFMRPFFPCGLFIVLLDRLGGRGTTQSLP